MFEDVVWPIVEEQPVPKSEKEQRLEYWKRKTDQYKPTIETMLLLGAQESRKNKKKMKFHEQERREILGYINRSCIEGKRILDLGAGIGRYTEQFIKMDAKAVTAVDLIEDFIAKNRETNGSGTSCKVEFLTADAMDLEFPNHTFDLVFSNWLFMYLSDEDVIVLRDRISLWLENKSPSFLFFRESCVTSIGGNKSTGPAKYRDPEWYDAVFQEKFQLVSHGNIKLYEKKYNNPNQYFWLWERK